MTDRPAERYWDSVLSSDPPPAPACADCRDSGWIEDGRYLRPCPCRSTIDGPGVERRLAAAGMQAAEIALARKPWAREAYQPDTLEALDDLHAFEWQCLSVPLFALWGPPGSGKTSAAARAAAAWVRGRRGSLAWCSVKGGLDQAVAERYDRSAEDAGRLERSWREAGLLVLDGLGEESDHENRVHILEVVLTERERRGLPAIITSNADPRRLLDGRLVSRFQAGRVVEVVAPDFRGVRR